jgi:hypothetical protein
LIFYLFFKIYTHISINIFFFQSFKLTHIHNYKSKSIFFYWNEILLRTYE